MIEVGDQQGQRHGGFDARRQALLEMAAIGHAGQGVGAAEFGETVALLAQLLVERELAFVFAMAAADHRDQIEQVQGQHQGHSRRAVLHQHDGDHRHEDETGAEQRKPRVHAEDLREGHRQRNGGQQGHRVRARQRGLEQGPGRDPAPKAGRGQQHRPLPPHAGGGPARVAAQPGTDQQAQHPQQYEGQSDQHDQSGAALPDVADPGHDQPRQQVEHAAEQGALVQVLGTLAQRGRDSVLVPGRHARRMSRERAACTRKYFIYPFIANKRYIYP